MAPAILGPGGQLPVDEILFTKVEQLVIIVILHQHRTRASIKPQAGASLYLCLC
jgi:hypothetical protein